MKITEFIEALELVKKRDGNIEVTCTAVLAPDDESVTGPIKGNPFETTAETLKVIEADVGNFGEKRVRVYL